MKIKKIVSLLVVGSMVMTGISACSNSGTSGTSDKPSGTNSNVTSESKNESGNTETMEKTYKINSENAKLLGRTTVTDDMLWCAFSGTGAEFTLKGTKAEVKIKGDSASSAGNDGSYARVGIYVDGERVVDEMINESEKTFEVFKSETEKEVVIKIVKLSETANSTIAIKEVKVTGEIKKTEDKAHLVEFIGDSITCGYGVDDENKSHHFSTKTEDVTKAYAYKTAETLGVDYSMVSISGYGVISGYSGDGKKVPSQALPQYYDKLGFSWCNMDGKQIQDVEWDFTKKQPELIVINLGTNDDSYCKNDAEKKEEYKEGYVQFIKQVREKNPDAKILCVLGVMGAGLFPTVEAALEEYTKATEDTNVDSLKLTVQDGKLGYAADWHPTEATHEVTAKEVSEKIKTIMNW